MSHSTRRSTYFTNLDVLRFVLSLFVVIYHIPEISSRFGLPSFQDAPVFMRGNEAVYWFFVLSGFLLSFLARKEILGGVFSVGKFIQRRIMRIWPLYYIVCVIGILLYYFILPAAGIPFENQASLQTTVLLSLFFLSNILHAFYDPGGILTITWSVSVEEQFYLLFPFLVLAFFRYPGVRKLIVSLFLFLFIFGYASGSVWAGWLEKLGLYFELFLIGILASELLHVFEKISMAGKQVLLITALLLFAACFCTDLLIPDTPVYFWRFINGLCAAFVILVLSVYPKSCHTRWLVTGGRISYGIYMYHMIVITFAVFLAKKLEYVWSGVPSYLFVILFNAGIIFVTYVVAYFSYRYIESWFLRKKRY